MERSVNVTGHRCFAIRDDNINIKIPELDGLMAANSGITHQNGDQQQLTKAIKYRLLQSEICGVQFCNKPYASSSYEVWLSELEQKVHDWSNSATAELANASECVEFGVWHTLLMLHRPCLANPDPSETSIRSCFAATKNLVSRYWLAARQGCLRFPWHCVHHCFEAGVVLLYNVDRYHELFTSSSGLDITLAFEILNQISNLLSIVSDSWRAAEPCSEFFDSLKRDVMRYVFGPAETRAIKSPPEAVTILESFVLHRPGDTQWLKSSHPFVELDLGLEDGWDLAVAQDWLSQDDLSMDMFDFSTITTDFDNLNWQYNTASSTQIISSPDDFTTPQLPDAVDFSQDFPVPVVNVYHYEPMRQYVTDALAHLPPCIRCRERHVKCDIMIPSCRKCVKSGHECQFYDAVRARDTPRPYVYALKQTFDQLMGAIDGKLPEGSLTNSSAHRRDDSQPYLPTPTTISEFTQIESGQSECSTLVNASVERYFGVSSIFARLVQGQSKLLDLGIQIQLHPRVDVTRNLPRDELVAATVAVASPSVPHCLPPWIMVETLVDQYCYSLETFFPIFGRAQIRSTLKAFQAKVPTGNTTSSANGIIIRLIMAVTTRLLSRTDARMREWSRQIFHQACLGFVEGGGSVGHSLPRPLTLRLYLLICWYLWLAPDAGNVWRMVGHGVRVAQEVRRTLNWEKANTWADWAAHTTLFRMEW